MQLVVKGLRKTWYVSCIDKKPSSFSVKKSQLNEYTKLDTFLAGE